MTLADKLLARATSYRLSGPSAEHTAALLEEAALVLTTAESERDSWRRVCERLETEKQAALAERDELLREKERLGAESVNLAACCESMEAECLKWVDRVNAAEKVLRTLVAHYPMGINPFLDDAFRAARSALENGPAGLADAHSKSPAPSSQSERIAVLAEREACAQSISSFIQASGNFGKSDDYLQGFAAGANYTAERNAAAIRARAALAPLGEE